MSRQSEHPIAPGRHSGVCPRRARTPNGPIPDVFADPEYSLRSVKESRRSHGSRGADAQRQMTCWASYMIYRSGGQPFTDKQIALVETFADQAAIAIENVRLLNALRQRTDELGRSVGELRALGEVSQAVNSTLDLETVLSTIVAKAVQLSGTEAGAIYVFDDRATRISSARHLRHGSGVD